MLYSCVVIFITIFFDDIQCLNHSTNDDSQNKLYIGEKQSYFIPTNSTQLNSTELKFFDFDNSTGNL